MAIDGNSFHLKQTRLILIEMFLSNSRKQGLNSAIYSVRGEIFIGPDRGGSDVAKLIMPDAIFPP